MKTNLEIHIDSKNHIIENKESLKNAELKKYNLSGRDLDVEKAKKIQQLKQNANAKFKKNQWYYDREIKLDKMKKTVKKVPQEILDEDALIYDAVDLKEAEILALTTYSEIINYNIML